eukprot:9487129-Pyramimonas_sp.AAC.2
MSAAELEHSRPRSKTNCWPGEPLEARVKDAVRLSQGMHVEPVTSPDSYKELKQSISAKEFWPNR